MKMAGPKGQSEGADDREGGGRNEGQEPLQPYPASSAPAAAANPPPELGPASGPLHLQLVLSLQDSLSPDSLRAGSFLLSRPQFGLLLLPPRLAGLESLAALHHIILFYFLHRTGYYPKLPFVSICLRASSLSLPNSMSTS